MLVSASTRLLRVSATAAVTIALVSAGAIAPAEASTPSTISGSASAQSAPGANVSFLVRLLNSTGTEISEVSAAADGSFTFDQLSPGDYKIEYDHPYGAINALTPYWSGAGSAATAPVVHLAAGQTLVLPRVAVPPGASISGSIAQTDGTAVANPRLRLLATSGTATVVPGMPSDDIPVAPGAWTVAGLWPGTYTVQAVSDSDVFPVFWKDTYQQPDATPIPVGAGKAIAGIDIRMLPKASIRGTVTGTDANGVTTTLRGASVELTDSTHNPINWATTDDNGNYLIRDVFPGDYTIQFAATGFGSQYLGGTAWPSQRLTITAGQEAVASAALSPDSSISGTLTYLGKPLPDKMGAEVAAWVLNPATGAYTWAADEFTDASGHYEVGGLSAATYRIEFLPMPGLPFAQQYWPGAPTASQASPVPVAAQTVVTGIDDDLRSYTALSVPHDYATAAPPELLARNASGALFAYRLNGQGSWKSPAAVQVGSGWNGMRVVVTPGDFTGDRKPDVIAADAGGLLWLYPGNGANGWGGRSLIGSGWGGMRSILGVGDFDGDGNADLAAVDGTGGLWLYPGDGHSGFKARSLIGSGWNSMTAIIPVGDWDGDREPDLLARDAAGNLWWYQHYWGPTARQWNPPRKIGTGWNIMTSIVSVGDATGDGYNDLLARDSTGNLYVYPRKGFTDWGYAYRVGTGWNVMNWLG
ncbi:FG-GAP-like repeat-containing protein [Leifsonia sp. 2TAF2]|uniref:FG-GAP-like repeat-containing protein n=1 Tax=Leifsonia sp. 2TAF2 TaxID=3233009 RepID=UPI003F966138